MKRMALIALAAGMLVLTIDTGAFGATGDGSQDWPARSRSPVSDLAEPTDAPAIKEQAANSWHEGAMVQEYTFACVTGDVEVLGGAWNSWFGDPGVFPRAGDVYTVAMSWGIAGQPCSGGAYVHAELGLPAYTSFAITPDRPVRCFYKRPGAANYAELSRSECPQQPGYGVYGGASFDPTTRNGGWPSATGSFFEIWIPVKTSQPTSAATFLSGIWMIDGWNSPWVFPQVDVPVATPPAPPPPPQPFIDYPYPSTVDITHNHAQLVTHLYTNGTTDNDGDATCEAYSWFELGNDDGTKDGTWDLVGTFGNGGRYCETAEPPPPAWQITQNMENLSPDKPYFWRFCYHWSKNGGGTKCGVVQGFRSNPSPTDSTAPNTFIIGHPKNPTRARTATFVFNSNETDTTFKCKRDSQANYTPCPLLTPTYKNLTLGPHILRVKAIDAADNVDPTPAVFKWKIIR